MKVARPLLLVVSLTLACAPITTNTRIESTVVDHVSRRTPAGPPQLQAQVEVSGPSAHVAVERVQPCVETQYAVIDRTAHHERRDDRRLILWEWLGGAVLAGGGAVAISVAPSLSDEPGIDESTGEETISNRTAVYIIGGVALAGSLATLVVALVDSIRAADRSEQLPRIEEEQERRRVPCGPTEPIAGSPIVAANGEVEVRLGTTGPDGTLDVNLDDQLPAEDIIGPPNITSLTLSLNGDALGELDLRSYVEILAEREWVTARQEDSVEQLDRFALRFPDVPQATIARARSLSMRETSAWETARFTDTVDALEGFVASFPESSHADEARARARALRLGDALSRADQALTAGDPQAAIQAMREAERLAPGDPAIVEMRERLRDVQIQARVAEVLALFRAELRQVSRAATEIGDWGRVSTGGARRRVAVARQQISESCERMGSELQAVRELIGDREMPPQLEQAVRQVQRTCRGR